MLETKTSQSHQTSPNMPRMGININSSEHSEPNEVHWLVVEDDKGRREIPLGGQLYSLGRDSDSDIRLFSMFVSRRHATLVRQNREDGNYGYQIVDGDLEGNASSNGISLGGHKIQSHSLKHKDKILFGSGVAATYYLVKRDERKTESGDPFDITLIDPGMMDDLEG